MDKSSRDAAIAFALLLLMIAATWAAVLGLVWLTKQVF